MSLQLACIKGSADKERKHLKSLNPTKVLQARTIPSALQSRLKRYSSNSKEMHLALILIVTISFQIHSFTGACNQLTGDNLHLHDDMSIKDTLHNSQDSSHDDLLSLTRPKGSMTTSPPTVTAISRSVIAPTATTNNQNSSTPTNGTRLGSSVSLVDIHNFRLEYNKYRILSHLSITENIDEMAPEIDPNLRDKLITSTAFNEQKSSASSMAPLKLLYIDEENKVHQKSIPDMIVESCDCA